MDEALRKSGEYPNIAMPPGKRVHAATGEPVEIPASARVDSNTRWHELFGTPERAARTLDGLNRCDADPAFSCDGCTVGDACVLRWFDYNTTLEWLRGDA